MILTARVARHALGTDGGRLSNLVETIHSFPFWSIKVII